MLSHPARGVWIETIVQSVGPIYPSCRTPQGVCGLKLLLNDPLHTAYFGRTPQGVCGLKHVRLVCIVPTPVVAPRKGCVD